MTPIRPQGRVEEAKPHQRDNLLRRVAEVMNESPTVRAAYRHGGVDLFQGARSIGWIYLRIGADRSGLAWEKNRHAIAQHDELEN